ncbi:penicillin-binding protein 2 [Patescibacteria group bacterium]|nr:penicillin-binding protein 2 [Patescibacteria group bacterium]MBU3999883.1 penicillin-binding protein 2 [Patescibacteria group bacterium]MBU4056405.1 penicillin-binding protein 2 [Patescibacteria group bacterium]
MTIFKIQKISKYWVGRKAGNEMEFEESAPFWGKENKESVRNEEKINQRASIAALVIAALILILILQSFKLQIIDGDKFAALAENNRVKETIIDADRGVIYDRNGIVLVKNKPIFDLTAVPSDLPKDHDKFEELIKTLSSITGKDAPGLKDIIGKFNRSSARAELLLENIDAFVAISVNAEKDKLPGIEAKTNAIRDYQNAEYFSHIIGYTGRVDRGDLENNDYYKLTDFTGKDGLELFYEKTLRGKRGYEKTEVDSRGKIVSILNKTEADPGQSLILSTDANLQKKIQDALNEELKKLYRSGAGKKAAAAVALDPRNGKVLALVSLPSYDNNQFVDPDGRSKLKSILNDTSHPLLNRAISGRYPPGSTIKPVMAIAALSEGIVDKNTIIEDRGVISIPNRYYPENPSLYRGWNRAGLGPVNIISAIARSSDIFFYTVGGGFGKIIGLGVDKITQYFKKFNLGKKLGIDLPGENDGFVPSSEWKLAKYGEGWNLGNTYHISIGQGYLLVTPLQVASWTSVFANKGTIYAPQLVDKIISGCDNKQVYEFSPRVISSNIADIKYLETAREGMREAVLTGSARQLNDLKVEVAGKTGTAEFVSNGINQTHSWFTSFAPYGNPEIVLTVLIEGGGEGAETAVPVAKEVLKWYFENKQP